MADTILRSQVEANLAEMIRRENLHKWYTDSKWIESTRAGFLISCLNMLRVTAHDVRVWARLYGPWGATAMTTLGKKSVWKTQIEVLNSPHSLRGLGGVGGNSGDNSGGPGGSGPPGDPPGGPPSLRGSGRFGGRPRRSDDDDDDDFCDQAAREFKDIVRIESNRASLSGAIITAVAVTALGFPELSQSHWVARAFWISSLVTALLAVYYAGNLVWKVGRLFSGSEIRTWLRGNNQGIQDILGGEEIRHGILKTLTPALSSVLIVSAPGLLFSASVLCLLLGFGIYLGFVWTRALDTASGHGDSRSVFIVYLLVIAVFYVVYSLSDIVQDYGTGVTVGDIIMKSVEKLQTEWPKFVEAREKRKIREYEEHQNRIRQPELLETILRLGDETSQHLTAIAVELQKAQEWREKGQEVR